MEEAVALAQRLTPSDVLASVQGHNFLLDCLRQAGLEEDLIEDVAAACELQEPQWTALSLGACQCTPEEAAEKLFLTQDEATALVACARHHCLKAGAQFGDGSVYQPDAWQPPKPATVAASNGHATASLANGSLRHSDHTQHAHHQQTSQDSPEQLSSCIQRSIQSKSPQCSNAEHTSSSNLGRPSLEFPSAASRRQSLDFPSDASDISEQHEHHQHHESHSHLESTPEEPAAPVPRAPATLASRLNMKKEEAAKAAGPAVTTLAGQLAAKAQAKREQEQALREAQGLPELAAEPAPAPAPASNGNGIGRERPKPNKKTAAASPRNTHSSGGSAAGPITASAWLASRAAAKPAPGPKSAPSHKPVVSPSSSVSSASGLGTGTGPRSISGMSVPSAPAGGCKASHLKPSVPALSGPATVAAPGSGRSPSAGVDTPLQGSHHTHGATTRANSSSPTQSANAGSTVTSPVGVPHAASDGVLTPCSNNTPGESTTTIYQAPASIDSNATGTAFATPAAAAAVKSPTADRGRCSSAPPNQLSMPRPLSTSFTLALDPHESESTNITSSHPSDAFLSVNLSDAASQAGPASSATQGEAAAQSVARASNLRPPAAPASAPPAKKPTLVGGSKDGAQARYTALLKSRSLTLQTSGPQQPPRHLAALASNANTPSYARPTVAFKAAVNARFGEGEAASQETAMGARSLSGSGRSQSMVYRPSSVAFGARQPSRQQSFGSNSIQEEDAGKKKKSMFANISASLLRPTKAFLAWTQGKKQEEDAGQNKAFKARPLPKYMTAGSFRQSVDLGQLHNHGAARRATFASAGGSGPSSCTYAGGASGSTTQQGHSSSSTPATTPQHGAAGLSGTSRNDTAIPVPLSPASGIPSPAAASGPAATCLSAPVTPSRIPRPSTAHAGVASVSAGGALLPVAAGQAAARLSTGGAGACAALTTPRSASVGDGLANAGGASTAQLTDQMLAVVQ